MADSAVQRWGEMTLRWVGELAAGGGDWGRRQWNRELLTPPRQEEVKAFCRGDLTPHGAAAVFWYLVNSTFFDQRLEGASEVTVARYENLVSRPVEEFRRLCFFFGVGFGEEMVADVFASSVRKRSGQPITPEVADACERLLERLDRAYADKCGSAVAGGQAQ